MYKKGTKLRLKNIRFSEKSYLFKVKPNEYGDMDKYAGKIFTVRDCVWSDVKKCYKITFKEDPSWVWSEDYIVGIALSKKRENSI